MDTIIDLVTAGLKNLISKNHGIASATRTALAAVIPGQILILAMQASAIITEILRPQYIKRLKRLKLADIILSASLLLAALLIITAVYYLCGAITAKAPAA